MTDCYSSEAFAAGRVACYIHYQRVARGEIEEHPLPSNPHPVNSDEARCWRRGWNSFSVDEIDAILERGK